LHLSLTDKVIGIFTLDLFICLCVCVLFVVVRRCIVNTHTHILLNSFLHDGRKSAHGAKVPSQLLLSVMIVSLCLSLSTLEMAERTQSQCTVKCAEGVSGQHMLSYCTLKQVLSSLCQKQVLSSLMYDNDDTNATVMACDIKGLTGTELPTLLSTR
jgi:hypothetical protein